MTYVILLNVWFIMIVSLIGVQVGNLLANWWERIQGSELARWQEITVAAVSGGVSYLVVLGAAMALYSIVSAEVALTILTGVTVAGSMFIESIREKSRKAYDTSLSWLSSQAEAIQSMFAKGGEVAQS